MSPGRPRPIAAGERWIRLRAVLRVRTAGPPPTELPELARLALLFVIVPVLELILLLQMGRWVGFWPTLGLVITTGLVGAVLARMEGLRVVLGARRELLSGRMPTDALLGGICVLIGGALLLTPGILTDLLGFSLLLPPSRRLWMKRLRAAARKRVESGWMQATVIRVEPHAPAGPPEA